jgi:hypothetical protein
MLPDGIKPIYAVTSNHCLLDNSVPKLIGRTYPSKRYLSDYSVILQQVVEFDYGNKKISDIFFFENNRLTYSSISLNTEAFLLDCYRELQGDKKTSPGDLISTIVEKYTITKMGLLD